MSDHSNTVKASFGHHWPHHEPSNSSSLTAQSSSVTEYAVLFTAIWERIEPTLGTVTTVGLMQRALALTVNRYPSLRTLRVTPHGLDFSGLHDHLAYHPADNVSLALRSLANHHIDLLAMLTGDVLLRKLLHDLTQDLSA